MGKAYNGGFTASTGFKRTDTSPLDDSMIVELIADLTNGTIEKPYPMIEVGVLQNLKYYHWNGNDISLLSSWVPRAEGSGGGSGSGDMLKSIYDTNDNGIVDNSDALSGRILDSNPVADRVALRGLDGSLKSVLFKLADWDIKQVGGTLVFRSDTLGIESIVPNNKTGTIAHTSDIAVIVTKAFVDALNVNAATLGGRSLDVTGSGGTIPYRTPEGYLAATGIAISGNSNPLTILRGNATVSAITKAEIDNLNINASQLAGRVLSDSANSSTVAGRGADGSLEAVLFKLNDWDIKQVAATLVFSNDTLGVSSTVPNNKTGTLAHTNEVVLLAGSQTIPGEKTFSSTTFVSEINFTGASAVTDTASIKATSPVSDTTYLDFLLADNTVNDKFRWRINPFNAVEFSAMELAPTGLDTADLTVSGGIEAKSFKIPTLNTAPTSSTATGTTGEIRYTADYIYVCVATNTWKRTPLTTW